MEILFYFLALLASILLILKAGSSFVDSACGIACRLNVSPAVIGLTVVSFATTAPELFTSLIAAWLGNVGMAYGNAIGSTIVNAGLILAVPAILIGIVVHKHRLHEATFWLSLSVLITLLTIDTQLSRFEGLLLLLLLAGFFVFIIRMRREVREQSITPPGERGIKKTFLLFFLSALGIIVGSRLLVYGGVGIALSFGISEAVIGFTLVAFGTSLPELIVAISSAVKKVSELSLGNIIGANIMNLTSVIGIASLIRPLLVEPNTLLFSNIVMLLIAVLLLLFMKTGKRLTRGEGLLLLLIYTFYLLGTGCLELNRFFHLEVLSIPLLPLP